MDMHTALRLRAEVDVKEWLKTHSVDLQDDQKQTLLHIAASEGLYDIATKLVKKGANSNAIDDRNWSPLHCAASSQMYDVCELLIHNKADVNARTKDENTPAHYIVKGTSNPESQTKVLDMLVQRNADMNIANVHGETPLIRACLVGSELVAAFVLGCGANVNALNSLDESALHQAVRSGRPTLVALLLLAGADINQKSQSGKTPIDEAKELQAVEVQEVLQAYTSNKEAACAVFRMETAELGAAVSAFKRGNLQSFVPTYKASEEDFIDEVRDLLDILVEEKKTLMTLEKGAQILERCAKLDSIITNRRGKGSKRKSSYRSSSSNENTLTKTEAKANLLASSSSPKAERKSGTRRTTVSLYMPTNKIEEDPLRVPPKPERRTRGNRPTLGASVDLETTDSSEEISAPAPAPLTSSAPTNGSPVQAIPPQRGGRGRGRGGVMTGRALPEPGNLGGSGSGVGRKPPNIRRESQDDITIGLSSAAREKAMLPPAPVRPRPPPKKDASPSMRQASEERDGPGTVDMKAKAELMAKLTAIHAGGGPPKMVEKSLRDSSGSKELSGSGGGMSRRQKVVKGFKTLRGSHVGSGSSESVAQGSPSNRRNTVAPATPDTPDAKPAPVEEVVEAPVIHDPTYYIEQLHLPAPRVLSPASSAPGATPEEKKLVARKNAFVEIICTENQYVLQLANVVAFYLKPLSRDYPDIISDEERQSIFSNIEHIFHISRDLLVNLEEEEKKPDEEQCIGAVFLKFIACLSYYKHYVTNFHEGMKTLDNLKNTNKAFSDYLSSILQRDDVGVREPLSDLLIRPFQRVCRYVLLIRELIKHVPEDWKDHADLKEAMDKIDKIVAEANETKRIMDNLMKLQEIEQSVVDWNVEIKQALKFILEGEFKEVDTKGHAEKRRFFLFNKMIIIVKPKSKGKYSMRMSAMLDDVMVWPMNDSGKVKNAFQIVSGSPGDRQAEKVTVCAKNSVEKENWINQINECISSTGAFDFIFD